MRRSGNDVIPLAARPSAVSSVHRVTSSSRSGRTPSTRLPRGRAHLQRAGHGLWLVHRPEGARRGGVVREPPGRELRRAGEPRLRAGDAGGGERALARGALRRHDLGLGRQRRLPGQRLPERRGLWRSVLRPGAERRDRRRRGLRALAGPARGRHRPGLGHQLRRPARDHHDHPRSRRGARSRPGDRRGGGAISLDGAAVGRHGLDLGR